jgi:signal transduction histidine kinase
MTRRDSRITTADSIGNAISELTDALAELARMPDDEALVGFVTHAMENYFAVSRGALDVIERALGDQRTPELAAWIEGLRHLGELIQHTMERLLHVSPGTELPLKPAAVDLPVLMQRVIDYHQPMAATKQLQIVCRPVGEVPPVWADRVAVAIVANNLLNNAVKFSYPHGDILIQIMPGPGGVVCSVRDHGPGLTLLQQARLFEHAESPTSMPMEGEASLGHGLAIAKDLVDRMSGRLWAENEPGRGARFFFRLPYQMVKEEQTA